MATQAQIAAVERLVRESVANIDRMAPDALRAVLPALRDARDELQRDLTTWLATVDNGANRFTAYERTRAIRALDGALDRVKDLEPAMARALAIGRHATGPLAVGSLETEITRLASIFGDGLVTMPQIDTAAVIARGDRLLWKRHARSAARYAGDVGNDIRHQFAVGLAKHETFEQLTTRLRRLGGGRGVGLTGDAAGEIADGLMIRHRHWANRLVRTEMMHGYNVQHGEAIDAVNDARPDDEDPYLRRWDAAADNVTCPICKGLDRTLATIDGEFKGGIKSPPAHPHCRCVVLAWLERWGGFKGEVPSVGPTPKAPPRPPPKPRPVEPPPPRAPPIKEQTAALHDALGWQYDSSKHIKTPAGDFTETMLKRPGKRRVAIPQSNIVRAAPSTTAVEPPPIIVGEKKNPKRVAAAQKAAAASAERRREIYSGVRSNLSQELQVAWEREGHKFMQEEAPRVRGVKDRMTAASKLSEAFTEKYGSGQETAFGNEGDRWFKRAEIEARHAEQWADAQEAKYYAAMQREAIADGDITDHGKLTTRGRSSRTERVEWKPVNVDDDDPPF